MERNKYSIKVRNEISTLAGWCDSAAAIEGAKGYDVLNPTRLPPSRLFWIYKVLGYRLTLLYDLWHLMRCDGITMLAGWEQSRGARLEKATAEIFNIKELWQN